jgi:hypothetical protein
MGSILCIDCGNSGIWSLRLGSCSCRMVFPFWLCNHRIGGGLVLWDPQRFHEILLIILVHPSFLPAMLWYSNVAREYHESHLYWCNGTEPGLPFVGAPWHTNPWVKGEKIHRAWLAGQIFNATCIICALLSLQLFAPPCSVVSLVLQQGHHSVVSVSWLILIAPVHFYLHGVGFGFLTRI